MTQLLMLEGPTGQVAAKANADGELKTAASTGATQTTLAALLAAIRPATAAQAVTLGADFTVTINSGVTRALFVGTGGAVKCTIGGTSVTFTNVPDGTRLDVAATLVSSTANGTSASDIVALG